MLVWPRMFKPDWWRKKLRRMRERHLDRLHRNSTPPAAERRRRRLRGWGRRRLQASVSSSLKSSVSSVNSMIRRHSKHRNQHRAPDWQDISRFLLTISRIYSLSVVRIIQVYVRSVTRKFLFEILYYLYGMKKVYVAILIQSRSRRRGIQPCMKEI